MPASFYSTCSVGQIPAIALIGIVAIAGSALGVYRHRLWAAYVLVLAELLEFSGEWAASGKVPPFVALLIIVVGVLILTNSSSALSPEISILPLKRIVIAGFIAATFAGFVSGLVDEACRIEFALSVVTANSLENAIEYALWVVCFAVAAKRAPWSFETALGAAIVALIALGVELLVTSTIYGRLLTSDTLISLGSVGMPLIACGVLGEAVAVALSPFNPELSPEFVKKRRELAETAAQWQRSQDIKVAGAGHENEDFDTLSRLLVSPALSVFVLREPETLTAYRKMFEGIEPSTEDAAEFGRRSVRFIASLSDRAGRRIPPLSVAESESPTLR
jgi:hypothetical protein